MSDTETDTIEGYDQPDYQFDESDIVGVPTPPTKQKKKKQDKRSQSSKANIVKAIEARKKKKMEEFEIEEVGASDTSDDEEYTKPKKTKKKIIQKKITGGNNQSLYTEQQLSELRNIVTSLAKAQKKATKQKKTVINIPNPQQPTQPVAIPEKKDPAKEMMKNSILRF
jgi:hypothetical protein